VSLIGDVKVPARAAGIVEGLEVREGRTVKAEEHLAQISNRRAMLDLEVASRQHDLAKAQAENDVDLRYSSAQADVSNAEAEEAKAANRISAGAVAATEVRRLELAHKRAKLAVEQASVERKVAGLTHKVRAAELDKARHEVEERRVAAPFTGEVVQLLRQPGEWVQAGEPVLRLIRMDRLRVEGFVDASQFGDAELVDCEVRVAVERHRGKRADFKGKIVFVNPIIEASGNYRVWAEVENHQEESRWVLRPGMETKMTVMLRVPLTAPIAAGGERQ
jgi:multidrug efflux pump subunit AcrA (membrane-fusion protein)